MPFRVGELAEYGSLGAVALFFFVFGVDRLFAWLRREPRSSLRMAPTLILVAAVGALLGCVVQPVWDEGQACHDAGQPITCKLINFGH